MVGLSHAVLRQIVKDYLPEHLKINETIWPTEMLNSRRVPNEILGSNSETYVLDNEINLVPQLLGNKKEEIQNSVIRLNKAWDIFGIDINMGCPVQKALKHNYGVSLMGDIDYAASVVKYTFEATEKIFFETGKRIPISVKLRAVDNDKTLDDLCRIVERFVKAGANWITLHPRTAEQKRKGRADWSQIAYLKKNISVPIIGNGDIQTLEDIFDMIEQTSVNKVMSGRALTARPWLFWQLSHALGQGGPVAHENQLPPMTEFEEGAEYGRMLLKFIELAQMHFVKKIGLNENLVMRKIQFFVKTNHVWLQFGHELMSLMSRSKNIEEMKLTAIHFFNQEQIMYKKTELRQ